MSCFGSTCSVTLSGGGSSASLNGRSFSVEGIRDGRVTLRVNDRSVSLAEGETVPVESVRLTCTMVTGGTVTFTVTDR
ncbi:hypothetical protein FHU33_2716 [Blastococcus colisei]|uniref:Uncharacterized protein n=1 Tax=Blastococcus colisei TaxID=1564162 RepID=A0A543PGR9_9ACTN|nr:hypothetical protein FHU33_2716 [Blastococcus colisei]